MPLYAYACPDCGPFVEMTSLAAYLEPAPCPTCNVAAPRELSAPTLARAEPSATRAVAARHRAGCGCCAPGKLQASGAPSRPAAPPRFLSASDG